MLMMGQMLGLNAALLFYKIMAVKIILLTEFCPDI